MLIEIRILLPLNFNPMHSLLLPLAPMKTLCTMWKKEKRGNFKVDFNTKMIFFQAQDENTQKNLNVEK